MPSIQDMEEGKPILEKVTELEAFWGGWQWQQAQDRALLALNYKQRIKPFELIIGNGPAVDHQGAIAILSGKEPNYRLPITVQDMEQGAKMNKSERYISAIMREVDRRWRDRGHGPWLHDFFYYGTLGAVCLFPRIVKRRGQPAEFHCDILDPMNVFPSFGERGLERVARVYETSYDDAYSMALSNGWDATKIEKRPASQEVKITSYWDMGDATKEEDVNTPYNSVLIDGVILKPRTREEQFSRIPLVILPFNGVPWRAYNNPFFETTGSTHSSPQENWVEQWGRPIFWMNRELYRALDRIMSYEAERARRAAYSKYLALTADGQIHLTEEEFQKAEIITLNVTEGESLTPIQPASEPREARELRTELFSMMQRGGVNRLALGDLNLEISGVTL